MTKEDYIKTWECFQMAMILDDFKRLGKTPN